MTTFKKYLERKFSEMRPYIPGEDMNSISVSSFDIPKEGGMIVRDAANHKDQWYIAEEYLKKNFVLYEGEVSNDPEAEVIQTA